MTTTLTNNEVISMPEPFVPPPYPYDRLDRLRPLADGVGEVIDLSIGTPFDPPPAEVIAAFGSSGTERGYPPSIGTADLRGAASMWMGRRFGIEVVPAHIATCIGTKEFVGTLPQWMRLRTPERDVVLYPAVSYPTYAMGAELARCRAVPVPAALDGTMDFTAIDPADIASALLLWVNSPSNPTGALEDLKAAASWGRTHGVPVFSDECYAEFTWSDRPRTILEHGTDGVVAVHSLSKRSNLAGARVGFYAGDPDLVQFLAEVRKHVGMMVPGPAQAAGVAALNDDAHVAAQCDRYQRRLQAAAAALSAWSGNDIALPDGGFYLWFPVGDAWDFAERLMRAAGTLVSPGDFYGAGGAGYVRVAVVRSDDQIAEMAGRLGVGCR